MEILITIAATLFAAATLAVVAFFTGRFTKEQQMKRLGNACPPATTEYESVRAALDSALGTVSQLAATAELHHRALINFGQLNVAEWIQNHNRAFTDVAAGIQNLNERLKEIEAKAVIQQPFMPVTANVETLAQTLQQTAPQPPETLRKFVEKREEELRTTNEYGEQVEPYIPNVVARAPIAPPPPPPDFDHFPQAKIERGISDNEQAVRKLRKKGVLGGGKSKGKQ